MEREQSLRDPDAHPILECPPCTPEERIRWIEMHLAMAWDQIWWLTLQLESPEEYAKHKADGFKSPIEQFYGREQITEAAFVKDRGRGR